jgi:hypothetical protein
MAMPGLGMPGLIPAAIMIVRDRGTRLSGGVDFKITAISENARRKEDGK